MSDISKINPNGTEYNLKDATARTNIGNLSNLDTTEKTDLVSAINEVTSGLNDVNSNITSLKYQMILETSSSGTHAEKLASLATAYSNLTTSQKISSVIVFAGQSVLRNVSINGLFATEYLETNKTEITMAKLSGEYLSSVNGTVSDYSSVSNQLKFALWAAL